MTDATFWFIMGAVGGALCGGIAVCLIVAILEKLSSIYGRRG